VKAWIPHDIGRSLIGDLPAGVDIEVYEGGSAEPPSDPETLEFWVPPMWAGSGPRQVLAKASGLRVMQLLSAGADMWAGQVPTPVTLCDARGVHDSSTSEWVLTATLAYLRSFPTFVRAQQRGEWSSQVTDELSGKRVLIVGAGSIGTATARRFEPFEVSLTLVARRARDGVHGVDALPGLLPNADVVVLVVPLTPATTGLVDAAFLAGMPDGALLVNASRGPVVETAALTAELATGRIGAALDVTQPEPLPAGHPLWEMPNLLLTPHVGGAVRGLLPRAYRLVGEQLRRYVAGEPLRNVVTGGY
jgi:phosphoglycerate dehydrogenase-like enzyme